MMMKRVNGASKPFASAERPPLELSSAVHWHLVNVQSACYQMSTAGPRWTNEETREQRAHSFQSDVFTWTRKPVLDYFFWGHRSQGWDYMFIFLTYLLYYLHIRLIYTVSLSKFKPNVHMLC